MNIKKLSPITKLWFIISLFILLLWVIPTMVSYYKNQKTYNEKVMEIEKLDERENRLDAKKFHSELFKLDIKKDFRQVEVVPAPNDSYQVTISLEKDSFPKFYSLLKKLSLNYNIILQDSITYKEVNKLFKIMFVITPF